MGWLLIFAAILVGLLYVAIGFNVPMGRAFPASSLVVGFMLVANPGASPLTVTLLVTIFFSFQEYFASLRQYLCAFPSGVGSS
jgi:hypothetical protein